MKKLDFKIVTFINGVSLFIKRDLENSIGRDSVESLVFEGEDAHFKALKYCKKCLEDLEEKNNNGTRKTKIKP
jgi:hypothetical protein